MKTYIDGIEIKVGDTFIGKKRNEYYQETIVVTEDMLDDDENLCEFLHYYGFEKVK
jgi:hypothetical protein